MPKYLTIAKQIEQQIVSNALRSGAQLPTEKELMNQFAVSRQTVRNALSFLSKKNLIYTIKGAGTFVSETIPAPTNSKNIAVLMTNADNYIFPYKSAGINSVLNQHGYISNIYVSNNRIDYEEDALRKILSANYAGVILEITKAFLPRSTDLIEELQRRFPLILIDGYYPQFPNLPYVALDDRMGGYKATEYLIQHGHKDIFHIGKIDDLQGILRYQGYIQALRDYNLKFSEDHVFWLTEEGSTALPNESFDLLWNKMQGCTAIFFYNDHIASSILPELVRRGVRIPEDLSVMSYDNSVFSMHPFQLSCIAHPLDNLGRVAAERLLELMENPGYDATYIFQPEIVERSSVRNLNG
ncbi:MAG: GntR family transcriptional regulator [Eubacteriales bacterium]|nr:GntR family transcriptional regulator [Eubacteriales bacterium]